MRGRPKNSVVQLVADILDDAGHGARAFHSAADLLEHHVDIFFLRFDGRLADDLHDFVAAVLQPFQQFRRRMGRRLLEVVHQYDAFAVLLELFHHRVDDLVRLPHFEVERIHVGGEDAEIALAVILQQLRRVPQGGETEERSDRLVAKRDADSRDALLDFVDPFLLAQLGQVLVRPGVRSDA